MTGRRGETSSSFDSEPERTFLRLRREARGKGIIGEEPVKEDLTTTMDDEVHDNVGGGAGNQVGQERRVLGSYINPNPGNCGSNILKSIIHANNFELKPQLITLVQNNCSYGGGAQEDPNQHLNTFLRICDTVKSNEIRGNFERVEAAIAQLSSQLTGAISTLLERQAQAERKIDANQEKAIPSQENHKEEAAEKPENKKKEETPGPSLPKLILKPYVPKAPYPQRLRKDGKDGQFFTFLEIFKKLQINIPFAEVLEQMPLYAKFLKELMTRKRNRGEKETVVLTEECSAIIQKKLPQKMKDPGSFQIPCIIGDINIEKALCDLGASINLMSLNMMRRMRIEEAKPTRMALQLADRTFKFPHGVVEDLLMKVGEFIFPADFVVLDMEKETNTLIILGRPFLATAGAIIDV
ncbi:uncharacterized protein LOC130974986 [Arachis stenosperma]|uniref:uncharacterized protein LOC130974986 n=1 Tax=Arachis stenosperma TaxID=217475 RepID=UPI0025AC2899|nr:uncharacterized protein LOC130974986 [Arachis stenosperma]